MAEKIPDDVKITRTAREPKTDPTLGVKVPMTPRGRPPHRLVTIGDSLFHGFQSGAVYQTDLSVPAIIAYELGALGTFRFPSYGGPGGLPINIELLLRELQDRYGEQLSWWEVPLALFSGRQWMDVLEDYWERGPGSAVPHLSGINHNLAMYGWDLRDALDQTVRGFLNRLEEPNDGFLDQIVQNAGERAALRVYPAQPVDGRDRTVFQLAAELGAQKGDADHGIETLVVFLGANNALGAVTRLRVVWSKDGFKDLTRKKDFTVWRPTHFKAELEAVQDEVRRVGARHVIWCTVPHVTIAPIGRGVGPKIEPGSRYYPFYTRPWISDRSFDRNRDPSITAVEARAVDSAIDQYNDAITDVVRRARGDRLDWYLLDVAGLLDRVAERRYIEDALARPGWWTPYPLPSVLDAVDPPLTSRFLMSDGQGGRAAGGLFSLDGVHPTTVGYGILAQEIIHVMRKAGVPFTRPDGTTPRADPVTVDFARLLRRDTLVARPPQNLASGLGVLAWADETLDVLRRALPF
ncbi:hypothetical protein SAMN05444920_114168 [Nonomuraea solani]|uniref:GDSL-like Lipase/Acylhydrolase n=1 Tax=Nonomuraea solani TaxID=1144553 RepID=A0A1H6EPY9_9ACTN|nr:hypothetical protein [Nonomuraea solani]SEG99892.1 hypothetical protein SAMN05444920_114168 [Nonomuraea solani]